MNIFNDGDQKSEFVEKIVKQMQSVYESHLGEYKLQMRVNINNVQLLFKEKGDRLAKKAYKIEFLTHISRKLTKYKTTVTFFAYLRNF